MTNTPIGIPSGWEIVCSFYWIYGDDRITDNDRCFNVITDMGVSNWADYCDDVNDWRVVE